jgi:tetratricopeptide (TPR) repeat protein
MATATETCATVNEPAHLYAAAVDRLLALQPGPASLLRRAVALDPGFAPAHAGLALLHHRAGRSAAAHRRLERAAGAAARATRRERSHVAALAELIESGGTQAWPRLRSHLAEFPRDRLLRQEGAEVMTWNGAGDPRPGRLAFLSGFAPAYAGDWWLDGDMAFDLAEAGRLTEARRLARRALTRNPRHAGAAHSLAHVYFETAQDGEGAAFLRTWLSTYDPRGEEHSHLQWHLGLFELRQGHEAAAMEVYDRGLDPTAVPRRRLSDVASFLWRRHLAGARNLPWEPVRRMARRTAARPASPFQHVHAAMAFAGAGDRASMGDLLRRLRVRAEAGDAGAGEVSLPLAMALDAFGRGAYAESVRRLEEATEAVPRLGGSNAQRAIFGLTLVEARRRGRQYVN